MITVKMNFDPQQLGKELVKAAKAKAREHVLKTIRTLRDPETGERLRLTEERDGFKLEGPEALVQKAERLLKLK